MAYFKVDLGIIRLEIGTDPLGNMIAENDQLGSGEAVYEEECGTCGRTVDETDIIFDDLHPRSGEVPTMCRYCT